MKIISGKVVSAKVPQTITVEVDRFVAHPMYHKRMRRTKRYHAHDELSCGVGDLVKIMECKPVSRTKNWKVTKIVKKHGSA